MQRVASESCRQSSPDVRVGRLPARLRPTSGVAGSVHPEPPWSPASGIDPARPIPHCIPDPSRVTSIRRFPCRAGPTLLICAEPFQIARFNEADGANGPYLTAMSRFRGSNACRAPDPIGVISRCSNTSSDSQRAARYPGSCRPTLSVGGAFNKQSGSHVPGRGKRAVTHRFRHALSRTR